MNVEDQILLEGDGFFTIVERSSIRFNSLLPDLAIGSTVNYLWPEGGVAFKQYYTGRIIAISSDEKELEKIRDEKIKAAKKQGRKRKNEKQDNEISEKASFLKIIEQPALDNFRWIDPRRPLLSALPVANVLLIKKVESALHLNEKLSVELKELKEMLESHQQLLVASEPVEENENEEIVLFPDTSKSGITSKSSDDKLTATIPQNLSQNYMNGDEDLEDVTDILSLKALNSNVQTLNQAAKQASKQVPSPASNQASKQASKQAPSPASNQASKQASKQALNQALNQENVSPNDGNEENDMMMDTEKSDTNVKPKRSVYVFTEEIQDKTEELITGSDVFIQKSDLKSIKRNFTSQTTMARALLCAIFTEEALTTHSLTGKGTGKPGLPSTAIKAILNFVSSTAKRKQWRPVDDRVVKDSMRAKLKEFKKSLEK